MKKYHSKIKNIKKSTITFINKLKKDPRKVIYTIINRFIEIIKNNILFFVYVITLLFNTIILRYFTIGTIENVLYYKPALADLTIILVVGSFCFLFKEKNRFKYLLTANIILTLICIINSVYYTFYTSFTSISLLSTSKYAAEVSDAIFENVLKIHDLIYIWAPIALIITYIKLKKTGKIRKGKSNKIKFIKCLNFALVPGLIVIFTLTSLEIGRLAKQWNREYLVERFGIYVYHVNDLVKSVEPKITTLFGFDQAYKEFNDYYQDTSDEQEWKNKYTGIFEGKNIISIHLESMQSFLIDLEFNGEEVTPTLNKIANESLYFSNFYTQVSTGTSSDSELTFNTSLMPTNIGTAFVSYFNRYYNATPKYLKEKGYYTFAMHANNGSFWNRSAMHKSLGYDELYDKSDYEIDEIVGLGLSDKSFFRQSIEKIKDINSKGQPYYGTVIMLSNHTPFADVDKYGEFDVDIKETITNENGEEEIISYPYLEGTKMGNYIKSAHYADSALGEFIDSLEKEGLMENTVIVMYGDHDARLGKSEFRRLYNYDKETDGLISSDDPTYINIDSYQYEILRKTPFMIYSKETKNKLKKEITTVMGMYDVMPTLGNMFGFYNKYQLGHDIFEVENDNIVVFPNGNFITNKVYYDSQKGAYVTLKDNIEITEEYIKENIDYTEKLLSVSNSLIVYDLIKKQEELITKDEDYIDEGTITE